MKDLYFSLYVVLQAIKSFSRAIHLYPAEEELWKEDLHWAVNLLQQKKDLASKLKASMDTCESNKIVEIAEEVPGFSLDETSQNGSLDEYESKMKLEAVDNSKASQCKVQNLNQLPTNYVLMRDEGHRECS